MTTVYKFTWNEGSNKRLLEEFSLKEGMEKVLSLVLAANKEGLLISGMTSFATTFEASKKVLTTNLEEKAQIALILQIASESDLSTLKNYLQYINSLA